MLPAYRYSIRTDSTSDPLKPECGMGFTISDIRDSVANGKLDVNTAEFKHREKGWRPLLELLNPPRRMATVVTVQTPTRGNRLAKELESCATKGCAFLIIGVFFYVAGAIAYHFAMLNTSVISVLPSMVRPEAARYGYAKGFFAGENYGTNHKEAPTVIELDFLLGQAMSERLPQFDKDQWSAGYKAGFEAGFHEVNRKAF